MKIRKTMTDKAIKASQENGKKGNGPTDPSEVPQNARKHGLASKYLAFQNEEERQEFDALLNDLVDEYQPEGRTQVELVNKSRSRLLEVGGRKRLGNAGIRSSPPSDSGNSKYLGREL